MQREPTKGSNPPPSPALSMLSSPGPGIATRKIAVLAADGFAAKPLHEIISALERAQAVVKVVAPTLGSLTGDDGSECRVDFSFLTTSSVLFDAVYIAGGSVCTSALVADARASCFVREAFEHCKSIAATGDAIEVLVAADVLTHPADTADGVYTGTDDDAALVAAALVENGATRHWSRE